MCEKGSQEEVGGVLDGETRREYARGCAVMVVRVQG